MTQEDKDLLFKDLCSRLPYNTKVKAFIGEKGEADEILGCVHILNFYAYNCKPYLRPMSSMTEEEFAEYEKANDIDTLDSSETLRENMKAKHRVRISKWYHGTDWLNAHHFDYRGLIPMGLALEAPEGMYE